MQQPNGELLPFEGRINYVFKVIPGPGPSSKNELFGKSALVDAIRQVGT